MSWFGPPSPEKLAKRVDQAIREEDIERLRKLLAAGADPNRPKEGRSAHFTPLYSAVYNRFTEGFKLLREHGASIDVMRADDGHTPLMEAASDGSYTIAEMLLKDGAPVNHARTDDKKTALHVAAERGRGDLVKLLLRHGADPAMVDSRMNTAADLADKEHPRLADFLRGEKEAAAPAPTEPQEGWFLTRPAELAHVEETSGIGYRLTEIFNFKAGVYTRIARNLATDQESQTMRLFEEMQGSQLLVQAEETFRQMGGDAAVYDTALSRLGKKPVPGLGTGFGAKGA